jgi:hypothetical protein
MCLSSHCELLFLHCEFNSIRFIAAFLVYLGILQFIEWVNEHVILFDVK